MASIFDAPSTLAQLWSHPPSELLDRLFLPEADGHLALSFAIHALQTASAQPVHPSLIPVTSVDERSFACIVCHDDEARGWYVGDVVRWHLDDIKPAHQGALLDIDLDAFIGSLLTEHGPAWERGSSQIRRSAERYQDDFVASNQVPKMHNLRPFQLACQNVIIGLAALRYDASIDATSVENWQTCDVPHVATNEGNRALSALALCDAFQAGGTMELSFARHPERSVPASLRRFGRTLGLNLGAEIEGGASISPSEARELFWAVTPMEEDLRIRARAAVNAGVCTPERLCYSLMAPIWKSVSLTFLLAVGSGERVRSILEGGTDLLDRGARQAERDLMRAALVAETLVERLNARDGMMGDEGFVRVFEDVSNDIEWRIDEADGAIEIWGFPAGRLPWSRAELDSPGRVVALPRPCPLPFDVETARQLAARYDAPVVIVAPQGAQLPDCDAVPVLRCPRGLPEIDTDIERNLLSAQLTRA